MGLTMRRRQDYAVKIILTFDETTICVSINIGY